ncbi:hypothetical protein NKR23_g3372 [Pleurostoma richardsiae]|uniref:Uncharacterized protein n=1 Tax=Pleurostoma richardsiae TaxID=41990 RepID=A0AA38VTW7_9PEZI|nr:hypothetical protein NKR23_g3372 [Pleurostoma richardsiae]
MSATANGTSQHPQAHQYKVDSILTDLDASLASAHTPAAGSVSPHSAADAQRAMSRTNSWTPAFNRRQSWNKEEQKHEQHMAGLAAEDAQTGPGFSERSG